MRAYRIFGRSLLATFVLISIFYLCVFGYEIGWRWKAGGFYGFPAESVVDLNIWFYRERGPDGNPSSPYRLSPRLSEVDPLDGPNWEIWIPAWIPAVGALIIVVVTGHRVVRGRRALHSVQRTAGKPAVADFYR